jgi:uncharacterized protein
MNEVSFTLIILILLVSLQSIVGVGVLVLGTPIMLLLEYNMTEILSTLLPISILTSLLNFTYFKLKKKKMKIKIDSEIKKYLVVICAPCIAIGLLILKNFEDDINLNLIISFVIISSILIISKFKKLLFKWKKKFKIFSLGFVGITHGITNSGGTILSIVVTALNKQKINQSRYNITFSYLFLAIFQYLVFISVFETNFHIFDARYLFIIVVFGTIIGNIFIKFIKENIFKMLINVLALISAIFLIIKS